MKNKTIEGNSLSLLTCKTNPSGNRILIKVYRYFRFSLCSSFSRMAFVRSIPSRSAISVLRNGKCVIYGTLSASFHSYLACWAFLISSALRLKKSDGSENFWLAWLGCKTWMFLSSSAVIGSEDKRASLSVPSVSSCSPFTRSGGKNQNSWTNKKTRKLRFIHASRITFSRILTCSSIICVSNPQPSRKRLTPSTGAIRSWYALLLFLIFRNFSSVGFCKMLSKYLHSVSMQTFAWKIR